MRTMSAHEHVEYDLWWARTMLSAGVATRLGQLRE
jgi:hypothetical protein